MIWNFGTLRKSNGSSIIVDTPSHVSSVVFLPECCSLIGQFTACVSYFCMFVVNVTDYNITKNLFLELKNSDTKHTVTIYFLCEAITHFSELSISMRTSVIELPIHNTHMQVYLICNLQYVMCPTFAHICVRDILDMEIYGKDIYHNAIRDYHWHSDSLPDQPKLMIHDLQNAVPVSITCISIMCL